MGRAADRSSARILVAEDNFLMAEVICDFVRACGLQPVGPVASVENGVRLAQEEELDAAALDINLQGRLCFPICSALAKRHVPFVFLTGYTASFLIPSEYRAARYLEKPFSPEEFETVLQDLVARRLNGDSSLRLRASP